jgi:predicted dehydrogenase
MRRPVNIALLGGGRWGRVYAGVLVGLLAPEDRILWVTRHNQVATKAHAARVSQTPGPVFEFFHELDTALARMPTSAIVATVPSAHLAATMRLLEHNVPVLVEKPFALTESDAQAMIAAAAERKLVLGLSLPFLSARYLYRFAAMLSGRTVTRIEIGWRDPACEIRYGEKKIANFSVHKISDVYPHIWSVLRCLFPKVAVEPVAVHALEGGAIDIDVRCGKVICRARHDRRAGARERSLRVFLTDGSMAALDFTDEPGTVVMDGKSSNGDPDWDRQARPLSMQIRSFLTAAEDEKARVSWPLAAQACFGTVIGAAALERMSRAKEISMLVGRLQRTGAPSSDPSIAAWLIDNVLPELAANGEWIAPDDDTRIDNVVRTALVELAEVMSPESGLRNVETDLSVRRLVRKSAFLTELTSRLNT